MMMDFWILANRLFAIEQVSHSGILEFR